MHNLPVVLVLLGRLNILVSDVVRLLRFESPRLNGSYDELAVNCGGVVAEMLAVVVCPYEEKPFLAGLKASTAFLRAFINRNSRSIKSYRLTSTSSNDSSLTGSSASICCFRIFKSFQKFVIYYSRPYAYYANTHLMKRRCIRCGWYVGSQKYRMSQWQWVPCKSRY